jgi:hypothetical protein
MTDLESHTPFCPYNLRVYRQSFFGIRDLLLPLVCDRKACVLPMQTPVPGRPLLLEICPASLLKRENLYSPYKGKSRRHRVARMRILRWIAKTGTLSLPAEVQSRALHNSEGDALDSILAAFTLLRVLKNTSGLAVANNSAYAVEGHVYT